MNAIRLWLKERPLIIFLIFGFFVLSLPFTSYPLTDADIANWADVASEIAVTGNFLTGANDQSHGPLISWTSAIFLMLNPHSFYLLNFFNLLCGLLAIYWMYRFSERLWQNPAISQLCTFFLSTCLFFIYLSRTPLYDWPATVFYFGFCGYYLLYVKEHHTKDLIFALIAALIGSLSRFSIVLGLSGIYIIFLTLIFRRSFWLMVRDGALLSLTIFGGNAPWFLSQIDSGGISFIQSFIYDNTGRYVKSTRPGDSYRGDFYGFSIYVLIGVLPHTFSLVTGFFNRAFLKIVKSDKLYQALIAAFLPCLILFSFSGHTKLARYIAYVFPMLLMLLGHFMYEHGLPSSEFRQRAAKWTRYTAIFLGLIFALLLFQFPEEAASSPLFVAGVIILLMGLLHFSYYLLRDHWQSLRTNAVKHVWTFGLLYIIFFGIIAYETPGTEFLEKVDRRIKASLQRGIDSGLEKIQ